MRKNKCIKCSVHQCKHNVDNQYCTLSSIKIGTHESCPSQIECTDCSSFELK